MGYPRTLQSIPTMEQYEAEKKRLASNRRALISLRLTAETGMTRLELVTNYKSDLDRKRRDLYLHRSKAVKKIKAGKIIYVERNRHVPINYSLMPLLEAYMDSHDSPYIMMQEHHYKDVHSMSPESINALFLKWEIPWSPHKFRKFFRTQVKFWMITNKQVDIEVLDELMGHNQTIGARYSDNPFDYKLSIVDAVFG